MLSPPSFDLKLTAHLGDHLHLCSSRLWCAFVLSSFEALGLPVWSYNHVFINQSEFILKNNYGIDSVTGVGYAIGAGLAYAPTILFLDEWFVVRKGFAYGVMWVSVFNNECEA